MKFFKTFLAALLAFFAGIVLLFVFFLIGIASSSSEPEPYVRKNTVLTLKMSGALPDRASTDPVEELLSGGKKTPVTLESLKRNLEKAAADDRIAGIWMDMEFVGASWANLEQAHALLSEFKQSGKFIYASTGDIGYNEQAYYLATTADSIFAPAEALFEFDGFVAQLSFYERLLDKIGVEPEIFRVGKYKSAVEPFMQSAASEESKEQIGALLASAKAELLDKVSAKTGRSVQELDRLMDRMYFAKTATAFEEGLIDALASPQTVETLIKQRLGVAENKDLETVSFSRYARVSREKAGIEDPKADDKIAVIYASGAITPDLGQTNPLAAGGAITYAMIDEALDEVDEKKEIKGVVLHIDSPGGSAFTSELIWERMRKTAETKPVIAVMGSVAASGGYYIAMGADTVIASPNTITGSIGIFAQLFNAKELMNDRLGITFTEVQTDPHADIFQFTRPYTTAERRQIQAFTDQGYERFLQVVYEARGMTRDQVHALAQGRVWTGSAAHEAGLVDMLGTLDDGLAVAAQKAGIESYDVVTYPKKEDLLESLLGSGDASAGALAGALVTSVSESFARSVVANLIGQIPSPVTDLLQTPGVGGLLGAGGATTWPKNHPMALMPYRIIIE